MVSYGTPVWSPRGDLIAFTKTLDQWRAFLYWRHASRWFGRAYARPRAWHVEGPTWAPNGRVLMFFKDSPPGSGEHSVHMYSIDLTGYNEREVPTPTDASDPAWSPLLP